MSHLLPCPACNRHIDAAETACPFCAAPVTEVFGAPPPRAMPPRRLGRAALMAAGAALMGAAACSAAPPTPVPLYGGPFPDAGSGGSPATGGSGGGSGGAGGGTAGAGGGAARDAGEDRSVVALYGAAVPDSLGDSPETAKPEP